MTYIAHECCNSSTHVPSMPFTMAKSKRSTAAVSGWRHALILFQDEYEPIAMIISSARDNKRDMGKERFM